MNQSLYLQPLPDGLPTRRSGPWVEVKLDYVHRYIDSFSTAMKSKWPQRNFIDLFAGPGKNIIIKSGKVILGSPLLSLNTKYPFSGYYFADLYQKNTSALWERCQASPCREIVQIYSEDANKSVSKIVAKINREAPRSLNLAFLDPEGLELEWSTIATLGELRCDLIIHYSQQGITRYIGRAYESTEVTIVDRFFGTTKWRDIFSHWRNRPRKSGMHRELLDLYKERLMDFGYKEIKQSDEIMNEPLIRNTKRNAPLYRLIFASKHPLGEKLWQKITRRDQYGQKQMF